MASRPSSGRKSTTLGCPSCGKETVTSSGHPVCVHCGTLPMEILASAILSPDDARMDETLSASLAAPLPEEVLQKTGNPANLFGKYVLLQEIGRGATGTVVRAWDTYLSRTVALKFLHATATRTIELNDQQRVTDFLREARLAARLRHPNIVPIHEVDCRGGRFFISMDFISGGTLAEQIHGPAEARVRTRFYLEPARFLALLRKISLAVHFAHSQVPPVVHRDLKPQNVLVDAQDQPHVADFGLANEVREGPPDGPGGIRGTPAYMSPEQALGRAEEIDSRTDVYSLGIVLYEMLAGETPFHGENIPSVLRKIAHEPPEAPSAVIARRLARSKEVAAVPQEVRDALERICLKALAKNRDDRYPSALEFAGALDSALPEDRPGSTTTAAPVQPRPSHLRLVLIAGAVLALLAYVLPLSLRSDPPAAAEPPVPGEELARQAEELRSTGNWPAFRGSVSELRLRAPSNPRLRDFDAQLAARDAAIGRRKKEWTAALEGIVAGTADLAALRRGIREFPETEEEFRAGYRRALAALQASLLGGVRDLSAPGSGPAWLAPAAKERAKSLRSRIGALTAAAGPDDGLDARALGDALPVLDRVLAYQGLWTLRVNVTPFAEVRVLDGSRELLRDFTPTLLRNLEIGSKEIVELCWPSQRDPQRRWTTALPPLRPGTILVITGDLRNPELQVEHE